MPSVLREAGMVCLRFAADRANAHRVSELGYDTNSVDALSIPADRGGLCTIFNAFQYLPPSIAEQLLASAVPGRRPIAVIEFLQRKSLALLGMIFTPIILLFAVPFLRPFRWPWLLRTSLIPLIPFFIVLDGDTFGHADLQRRRAPGLFRKGRSRGLVRLECADNPLGPSTRSRDRAARPTPAECSGAWSRAVRQTCRGRS
jgi:hypothetical protein